MIADDRSLRPVVAPWHDPLFGASIASILMICFASMLFWTGDAGETFRVIQVALGCAVVAQFLIVMWRVFDRGWFEFFAYVLHMMGCGAAALTGTFRLEQYPQDLLYDQLAVLAMSGQLVLGTLVLASGPLRIQVKLDRRVLMICSVVVCTAALAKFGFYLQYTGFRSGAHLDIYTDGDALRDTSPAPIRILAAGAPLIGLLAITYPGLPRWCRILGLTAVALEFAIGIRSRPLFVILAAVSLIQYRIKLTLPQKVITAIGAIAAVLVIAIIGYYRENNSATADEYFWITLQSLFGIFEAGVFGAQIPDTAPIIIGQLWPLLTPTPLGSVDTVAKLLSAVFTPTAYAYGFGYSSAALTEIVMLFGPVLSGVIYPLAVLGIIVWIKSAITSRSAPVFLYGACVLPIAFYIWRAELWQLAVPAIKAVPFIAVLLGVDAFAKFSRPRAALRGEQNALDAQAL